MYSSKKYQESLVKLATALLALANPARLQVIEHLAKYHECPAGEISGDLPLCKSTVSQHMAKLREAGFISSNQSGVSQHYRLNNDCLKKVIQQLELFGAYVELLSKTRTECKKSLNNQVTKIYSGII